MGPDEYIHLVERSRSGEMESFEKLMFLHYPVLHRYVACRIGDSTEADDVLQDIVLLAWLNIGHLRNAGSFRGWLMRIAGNRCNRWYKVKSSLDIPVEIETLTSLADNRQFMMAGYDKTGDNQASEVKAGNHDVDVNNANDSCGRLFLAIEDLPEKQLQAIKEFYFNDMKVSEIAFMHNVPEGTVKRRLYDGRHNLKKALEGKVMDKFKGILPFIRPEIEITPIKDKSFDIIVNEVPWMYCVLAVGGRTVWGIYDAPGWELTDCCTTKTVSEAVIHNIECVQIELSNYSDPGKDKPDSTNCLYVHADDRQIQYVAASTVEKGKFKMLTLFDDEFIRNYSVEFNRSIKDTGFSLYSGDDYTKVTVKTKNELEKETKTETENGQFTIGAGVFDVKIGGRTFECLRVLDRWRKSPQILVENYMSREGRSILFRRYNHPLWKLERYGQRWDEKLPEAARLYINGEEYVHWYDCLSDTVF